MFKWQLWKVRAKHWEEAIMKKKSKQLWMILKVSRIRLILLLKPNRNIDIRWLNDIKWLKFRLKILTYLYIRNIIIQMEEK